MNNMAKAEILNCPKCVKITYSQSVIGGVHKMVCPNEKCGHEWYYEPYNGE